MCVYKREERKEEASHIITRRYLPLEIFSDDGDFLHAWKYDVSASGSIWPIFLAFGLKDCVLGCASIDLLHPCSFVFFSVDCLLFTPSPRPPTTLLFLFLFVPLVPQISTQLKTNPNQ